MKQLLSELTAIPGGIAHEYPVMCYIRERLKGKVDTMCIDGIGNLIVSKKGALDGPNVLLSAHADEVGFIVTRIEPQGFVRFELRGGHDNRTLPFNQVVISTDKGPVKGIIGYLSAHMQRFDNKEKVTPYTDLYIDIGAHSAEEAMEMGVATGDPITWDTPLTDLGKDVWLGHAFDDRCGCAIQIKMLETLDFSKFHGTVWCIFSTREEGGLLGVGVAARTLAREIDFDVALALDTTPARDTLEPALNDGTIVLGGGPTVKILDGSYQATPMVYKKLQKVAKENGIPYQNEIYMGIGTDAGNIYIAGSGIPSSGISIPSRYCHSARETVTAGDMENSLALLNAFLMSLEDKDEFRYK